MSTSVICRWIMTTLLCITVFTGCSTFGQQASNPFQNPPPEKSQEQASPQSSPSFFQSSPSNQASATPPSSPTYYNFPDIAIPPEMSLMPSDSFVVQNGQSRAGLLVFKGRVDPISLYNFFQASMLQGGWSQKGGFQHLRSILIYEKPERTCIINVCERTIYTYAEIYVVPTGAQK